jgi:hypothetical protein
MMSHAVVSEAGVRLSARRGFETLGDAARGLEALLIVEAGGARYRATTRRLAEPAATSPRRRL